MSYTSTQAEVKPRGGFKAVLRVPGDKSISQRLAIMAAISKGASRVAGFLDSEDCLNTMRAMKALGASVYKDNDGSLTVRGTGGRLLQPAGPLDMGNSGTGIRLLTGLLAGYPMKVTLTGDASLCSRPMKRIAAPLEEMGADLTLSGELGTPPIIVDGGDLKAIHYVLPMASAQVKSCIMLAGLHAEGTTVIEEPLPTRDHTERVFARLGIHVQVDGLKISMDGFGAEGPKLEGQDWVIPADFSSAAFWLAAAAGRPGRTVTVRDVGLNPRRTALLRVMERMGANIAIQETSGEEDTEPRGDITVKGAKLKGTEIGGEEIPNLIDELPLVAVLGALAAGKTEIRDARELRVKESDRIAAMVANLRLMGVEVDESDDGMTVHGPADLKAGDGVKSFGDHRIAMAMAILALYAPKSMAIHDIACTQTSYPTFWDTLKGLEEAKR